MDRIEIVTSISQVDPVEWDAVAQHPLSCHGWLRSLEQTSLYPKSRYYFLIRDRQGLAAAFLCLAEEDSAERSSIDSLIFGARAGLAGAVGLGMRPAIAIRTRLLRKHLDLAAQVRVTEALFKGVMRFAAERGYGISFHRVTPDEAVLAEQLSLNGFGSGADMPIAQMEINPSWSRFEDYLMELKRSHRKTTKNITLELSRKAKHGLTIQETNDPAQFEEIYRLLGSHHLRLNHTPLDLGKDLLTCLKANLGDNAVMQIARIEGAMVGVLVGIRHGEMMAYPFVGISHEQGRKAETYFNLTYNHSIESCIHTGGLRSIHYGALAYDVKVRRGCRLIQSALYVRPNRIHKRLLFPSIMAVRNARMRDKYGSTVLGHAAGNKSAHV